LVGDPIQSATPFPIDQFWWLVFQHKNLSDIDRSIFERPTSYPFLNPSIARAYLLVNIGLIEASE